MGAYIHAGGKIGVIIEVNCESDFVARNAEFQQLVHDLAMQICATDPRFVRKEDVTPELLEREKEVLRAQSAASGKPEKLLRASWKAGWESFMKRTACTSSTSSRTARGA